ncbi:hypothetical protein [Nostoc sp.]
MTKDFVAVVLSGEAMSKDKPLLFETLREPVYAPLTSYQNIKFSAQH